MTRKIKTVRLERESFHETDGLAARRDLGLDEIDRQIQGGTFDEVVFEVDFDSLVTQAFIIMLLKQSADFLTVQKVAQAYRFDAGENTNNLMQTYASALPVLEAQSQYTRDTVPVSPPSPDDI
jgi:hypothetical protein